MLAALDPAKLKSLSEKKILRAFETASAKIPAYRRFLGENNISPHSIRTAADFRKYVPVLDKNKTFNLYSKEIKKLCLMGEIKDVRTIISSSGYSGCFSYGLNTAKETKKSQETIDFMLDYFFGITEKKTLLINCLAMGIKIHSSLLTVVDTSVRPDIALGIVKTFASCYEQMIIVGENSFVKKILEDGLEQGIDWKKIKIHLILGEEILPENLRNYFADILGVDPDKSDCPSLIGSSFGVAEFGLNVFYETRELIRIRRLMQSDKKLKAALIGHDSGSLPALLHYNPLRVFVEALPKESGLPDIVLTNLEEDSSLPLVRYNIEDEGIVIPFQHLKDTLASLSYSAYLPRIRLPIVAIWGRDKITLEEGLVLRPEFVKELLYQDKDIASHITGNFKLSNSRAGLRIEIQTKEKTNRSQEFEDKVRNILLSNIPAKIEIIIYPYREFPYQMELNYEKKFQYLD